MTTTSIKPDCPDCHVQMDYHRCWVGYTGKQKYMCPQCKAVTTLDPAWKIETITPGDPDHVPMEDFPHAGGSGNRKPPEDKTAIGYARDPDDEPDDDEPDGDETDEDSAWARLGLANPFGSEDNIERGYN
jgi:hypothetical protein